MYWTQWLVIIGCFGVKNTFGQGQRIAPGVPPQHYQMQQPNQQMHQVPQQQAQHIPQQQAQHVPQQQQIPVQHVPVHQAPMHQQVPVQAPVQQQMHNHNHQSQQILNAANIAQEKAHIAEHMEVPIDTSKMTDQELQFHYFKMHDTDNNNKLDGCELIKSLIHWHEQRTDPSTQHVEEKLFKDEELVALIDPILVVDDMNKDGYIDYPEFVQAQQSAAATRPQ
ncbi:hypothetical protein KPH14_006238 [Odynerus spinipes]|uniref:EF-hand domain-containing protein n=1 Tax=Odynerus spinipes TaxID=1348599 RepID=A0AAD9VMX6_9HYME|nr:hypothetical protein KPH14_006238 [Odynerus spinipes]